MTTLPSWRVSPFVKGFRYRLHGPLFGEQMVERTGLGVVPGVGGPFQVGPDAVCIPVQRRVHSQLAIDLDDGTDLFVLKDLSKPGEAVMTPLVCNHPDTNPFTGRPEIMSHFQAYGGFVPLGAKMEDGRAHPAAGTGFMVSLGIGYPADLVVTESPEFSKTNHRHFKIFQLRYDGVRMWVSKPRVVEHEEGAVLPGLTWHLLGLSHAIADGEDLINGIECFEAGRRKSSGVGRWRYEGGEWRLVAFLPGVAEDNAREPSLVRDLDGSLLMCLRGAGSNAPPGGVEGGIENTYHHLRVVRSTDGGKTWEPVIHRAMGRAPTPIAIIRGHEGSMHLLGNPYRPLRMDSRGKKIIGISEREEMCWWPVSADRRWVQEAVTLLDANHEFGMPQGTKPEVDANAWWLDHPIGGCCRLSDGVWRTLIGVRCTDKASAMLGAGVTRFHGSYLLEFEMGGEAQPVWRF